MSMDGQGTHGVYKHCQKFQPAELAQERYTDDRRQIDRRQTDILRTELRRVDDLANV